MRMNLWDGHNYSGIQALAEQLFSNSSAFSGQAGGYENPPIAKEQIMLYNIERCSIFYVFFLNFVRTHYFIAHLVLRTASNIAII
jgi:hypothetical protein